MGACASALLDTRLRPEDVVTISVTAASPAPAVYVLRCPAASLEETLRTGFMHAETPPGVRSFGALFDALAAGDILAISAISVQCRDDDTGLYTFYIPMEHAMPVVDAAYARVCEMRKGATEPESPREYVTIKRDSLAVSGNITEDTADSIRGLLCMSPVNRVHVHSGNVNKCPIDH